MKLKGALTRKFGPLPAWAWLALLGGAVYLYRRYSGAQGLIGSSGTATPATTDTSSTDTSGSGAGGGPVTLDPGQAVYDPATGQVSANPALDTAAPVDTSTPTDPTTTTTSPPASSSGASPLPGLRKHKPSKKAKKPPRASQLLSKIRPKKATGRKTPRLQRLHVPGKHAGSHQTHVAAAGAAAASTHHAATKGRSVRHTDVVRHGGVGSLQAPGGRPRAGASGVQTRSSAPPPPPHPPAPVHRAPPHSRAPAPPPPARRKKK